MTDEELIEQAAKMLRGYERALSAALEDRATPAIAVHPLAVAQAEVAVWLDFAAERRKRQAA